MRKGDWDHTFVLHMPNFQTFKLWPSVAQMAGGCHSACRLAHVIHHAPCRHTLPTPHAVTQDARANWICNPVHKHRELRGLTSAGKSYRGLQGKGHNYAKARPSVRATYRRNQNPSLRRYR